MSKTGREGFSDCLLVAGQAAFAAVMFGFFFSSRRRHTRCGRDWSSDVCSSDLQTCRNGQVLLLDVAAQYANYNADLTRTIPVNGKFSRRQRQVYQAVLRVLRGAIKEIGRASCRERV